jgi:hypothetical protein
MMRPSGTERLQTLSTVPMTRHHHCMRCVGGRRVRVRGSPVLFGDPPLFRLPHAPPMFHGP